jgi:hypothetical protein
MASFIELTGSETSQKILVNLEEVTFIQVSEKKKGKSTILHLTSSVYGADRCIAVAEDYEAIKSFVVKAKLLVGENK